MSALARRLLFAAAGALAAASLTLALYAMLMSYLSPVWSAAATALLLSIGAGLLGVLMGLVGKPKEPEQPTTLMQTALESIRGPAAFQIGLSILTEAFEGWSDQRRRKRQQTR